MKVVSVDSHLTRVEICPHEINTIIRFLTSTTKVIYQREFQTIVGHYIEDIDCLREKLFCILGSTEDIEFKIVEFNLDELIIISNSFNQFSPRNNETIRQLFIEIGELIEQIENSF